MRFFLSIIIFVISLNAQAQQQYFRFDRITTHEGLPSDNARKIIQDKQGAIWIGTSEGLCRYDGYHITAFTYNPAQPHSLVNNFIYDLSEDENGNIWITTADGWCELLYNTQTFLNANDFKNFHGKLPDYNPEFILADHHHHIIMGGYSGSCILNLADSSFKQFSFLKNNSTVPAGIANMYQDKQGLVWISFQNSNLIYDPVKNKLFNPFKNPATYPMLKTASVLLKQGNNVWMGAWGKGIYAFDLHHQTFKTVGKDTAGIKKISNDIQPRKMIADNDGNLWLLLVDEGVYYMDFAHKNFQTITNKADDYNSIPSPTVRDIMSDHDGNIWIATDKGVARWNNHKENFQLLPYTSRIPESFIPASKNNLEEIDDVMESDSEIWMSVLPVGLLVINKNDSSKCRQIQIDSGNHISAMNRMINSIFKDANENIWLSTQEGFAKYDKRCNCMKPYFISRDDITINKYCQTSMMLQDNDGIIWVASKKGLGKLNAHTNSVDWILLPATHTTGISFMIKKLIAQNDSLLWLVTDGGLFCFNKKTKSFLRYSSYNLNNSWKTFDDCRDGLFISDSEIVLASTFNGLVQFNPLKKTFKIYSTLNGLSSNNINGLYADKYGALWITTSNGISRLNLKTQTFSRYDYSNGLKDLTFPNAVSFYPEKDGNVLLLDGAYILCFNPSQFAQKAIVPQVTFTSFEKYDNPVFFDKPLNEIKAIHLGYNERYFTIRFSTLNFENTSRTQYAYKMDRLDNQWHITNTPFVAYSNLAGGNYNLYVKASLDGNLWSREKEISISITPPFWQTWWFYAICAAVVFAVVFLFYRMRINQLKHEMFLRAKISRDLHDDVGSTLSSLHIVSALARKKIEEDPGRTKELLEKITESSERMTGNMQDIVWAVNPLNDGFAQIIARMQKFAAQMCEAKNIELFFSADEKIKLFKLPLQYRTDLFMIFKEAVNNLAKYSNACHAWIKLNKINKSFFLEIKDDGLGFNTQTVINGNGLRNMQARAKNLNGKITVSSEKNKGTKITLEFST